jgi:sugar O-acyltransferase (sialic acid O-acetyltransferase NeuD family)
MKQLLIIGAGGFGREVAAWARQSPAYRREWEVAGFLDDDPSALEAFPENRLPILGNTRDYMPRDNEVFLCAVGNAPMRAEIRSRFEARGAVFTRLIHESVVLGERVHLEPGVILCPRVVLTSDLSIGKNTALNVATAVGHDVQIGEDCQISSFCDITGFVEIGDRVLMGSGARIIPSRKVGSDAVLGAGSVVVRDVPEAVTVFGNPARLLTARDA